MDKNYYDILEINKNASQEIVEKAYKTLAKKYHPDLQEGEKKKEYEEKLKIINEAYEVLSDPEKRKSYDSTLHENTVSQEEYENLQEKVRRMEQDQSTQRANPDIDLSSFNSSRPSQKVYSNRQRPQQQPQQQYQQPMQNITQEQYNEQLRRQAEFQQQQLNNAVDRAFKQAYINDLRRRGVKIKRKKTLKDYLTILITIIVIIIVLAILWHIPFIHDSIDELYNENEVFRIFANIFLSFFKLFKK